MPTVVGSILRYRILTERHCARGDIVSFVDELKQRKVFRVAVAYLVVAWVAIQAASIALPTFDAPMWVLRVVILLFALGFPLALLLTWAVDLTPEGVRFSPGGAGSRRMLAVAGALLLLAIAWFYFGQPALRRADIAGPVTPAVTARSIAVLPFVNMSGDPKNEYFSDGLAETTLDMLAQVPDLRVVARTSSFAFKGKPQDMRQIGAALGAAHLLEGSVQQAGDTLRITVQLIRAADGMHLWSRHYDRPMVDVFKIQDEIASQVVQEMAIALPAKEQQRLTQKRTENVAAYQEYLKGNALMPGRKVAAMREAAQHFERAIALDPTYARAYAAASDAYNLLDQYGTITTAERERMAPYVDRALALAPDLGEAHISRATWLENSQHDLPGAEREYRRGVELAPSYATGYQWYGELLSRYGRVEESLAMLQRAAKFDPLSPIVQAVLFRSMAASGRYQAADTLMAKLHADHPDFAGSYGAEADWSAMRGDLVRALRAEREQVARDPGAVSQDSRCVFLLRFGALSEARRCLDSLASRAPDSPGIQGNQVRLSAWSDDWAGAQTQLEQMEGPDPRLKATVLQGNGRYADVLTIYRRIAPERFAEPMGALSPGQAADATQIGIALLHTGTQAQGRTLLRQARAGMTDHPRMTDLSMDEWNNVPIHVALGEHEQAIAALKQGVADGHFLDLAGLDSDPLLAGFRRDPRYQQILAPARAKAAAQVAAARAVGLL